MADQKHVSKSQCYALALLTSVDHLTNISIGNIFKNSSNYE